MSKPATLKDIADMLGVSTRTVARVIHNNGYVAEDTRKQIEAAIEKTGYRVNIMARGLRKQQSFTIGHLLLDLFPNPFFAGVAMGVERQANDAGYGVLLYNMQGDASHEQRGLEMLLDRRVDAIIFTTPRDPKNVERAVQSGVPVIQVERPTAVKTHVVLIDNYAGTVEAVEHLIQLGHRRIAFIGSAVQKKPGQLGDTQVDEERLAGYIDTLKKHALPIDERLVNLSKDYSLRDFEFHAVVKPLLGLDSPPTAIFTGWDYLAAGTMQVLYECGLRIPDDISVVGFDNTLAPYLTPPLTTVEQPMIDIGRAAAQLAIEQVEKETIEMPQTVHLSTHLVVRKSSGTVRSVN
jgi:DNA-binding LacI/PurR family transcriptional regulator